MLRGINRQDIFLDACDYERAIEILGRCKSGVCKIVSQNNEQKAITLGSYKLYGYCLMANHVHLLIKSISSESTEVPADTSNLAVAVKRIASGYAQAFNSKYQRCGALFQERYKSEPVETEAYFITVLRYIHQNPVKAAVVSSISDYAWSSYRDYQRKTGITSYKFALEVLGNDFENFMNSTNDDECLEFKDHKALTDFELSQTIQRVLAIPAIQICNLPKGQRDSMLRKAKEFPGVTAIQLARVTGVQVNTIWRLNCRE
jgi:REP element-mobilizing transposase RayT